MQDPVPAEPSEGPEPRSIDALRHAVDEAARLLQGRRGHRLSARARRQSLRWVGDAGISATEERTWMRALVLPLGVGMFGKAAAERRGAHHPRLPRRTTTFSHAWMTDQVARGATIRSMVVAPLITDDELMGALGVYSGRPGAFGEPDASLVRALADHAAASLADARLIDQLARSQRELARPGRAGAHPARDQRPHRRPPGAGRGAPADRRRVASPAGRGRRAPVP